MCLNVNLNDRFKNTKLIDTDNIIFEKNEVVLGTSNIKKNNIKILIDNGHSENTAGKRSPYSLKGILPEIEFYEYKWNREIANEIVKRLIEMGYNAEILVPEVTEVTLSERVERINSYCNDLGKNNVIVISIHANAAGNGSQWMNARGWSAYTTKGKTESDIIAEYLYDEAEKNFIDQKIRKDKQDGDRDWESDFYICQKSACPAVLTENFFYDNIDDVKYILSEEGKEMVIKTHVDGIINYIENKKEN